MHYAKNKSSVHCVPSKNLLCRSADHKGYNELIPGAVQRSLGINFTAEKNPSKPQLGDCLLKTVRSIIGSTRIPYLQTTSVGSHSNAGREKQGKDMLRNLLTITCCTWSHGLRQKLYAGMAVAAPFRVPSQRPLAPNVTSVGWL